MQWRAAVPPLAMIMFHLLIFWSRQFQRLGGLKQVGNSWKYLEYTSHQPASQHVIAQLRHPHSASVIDGTRLLRLVNKSPNFLSKVPFTQGLIIPLKGYAPLEGTA